MKKLLARLIVLLVVAGAVAGAYYLVQQIPEEEEKALTFAEAKRGDLEVKTHFRGELRAVRSLTLTAPNLGSQSQVIALAPAGALAQRGDLIFEFDKSERIAALEDDQLEADSVKEQLRKAETELEIRKLQDQVELTRAEYEVRRWELEVRRNELISAIDARKNTLSLEEAIARKEKLEEDIKNRLAQQEAELAVLREQLRKAELDIERERRRIEQARVLAPISGLVSILENRSGGRGGFGTTTPTVREGDQIPAGMSVAQLLDLSEMELVAKVEEVERANLREGQEAFIQLDALPGKTIPGKIKRLGTTASINVFRGEATKKFDCILGIDMRALLEAVGATPEQVSRILATSRINAEQGFGASRRSPGAGGGAGPEGAASGARQGGDDFLSRLPGPAQEKAKELLDGRELSELSADERRNIFRQLRPLMQQAQGGRNGPGGPPDGPGAPGGPAAGPAAAGMTVSSTGGEFSPAAREAATLPQAPEEGSDVDILLRPGLLADAEVIVARMNDVVYVPYQAVFDTTDGPIVYVWDGRRLQPREVTLGARSESQVVIAEGLEEGEQISLESPEERESGNKKKPGSKKAGKSSVPGGFPGGRGGL